MVLRFGPPTSDLRPPTSDLRPPTSDLRPPTSDLRRPTSADYFGSSVSVDGETALVGARGDDHSGGTDAGSEYIFRLEDNEPPLITLSGDNPQIIECGHEYVELDATATDNVSVSEPIAIDASTVDTTTPGTYLVTYDVTDDAGNAATQVARTVEVVDTTAPVITLMGDDPLSHECATPLTDSGATARDTCAGDVTASLAVTGAFDPNAVGSYTLTYTADDRNGNTASSSALGVAGPASTEVAN